MTYHAGLGVSPEERAIGVVDATGAIVEEMRAKVGRGALDDALVRLDLPLARLGMAACSLAAWLHDGLAEAGWPAICIEARQAAPRGCGDPTAPQGTAMKTMPHEADRNNAWALLWGAGSPQPRTVAQIMRTGWFHRVHVKSRQSRRWRSLLVARRMVSPHMRGIGTAIGREDG